MYKLFLKSYLLIRHCTLEGLQYSQHTYSFSFLFQSSSIADCKIEHGRVSPQSMKGILIGLYYSICYGISSLVAEIPFSYPSHISCGIGYYLTVTAIGLILYRIAAYKYKYICRVILQPLNSYCIIDESSVTSAFWGI